MYLVARGMVRGEGKTDGYYERIIPLHPTAIRSLGSGEEAGDLGALAKKRIEEAGKIRNTLRAAIGALSQDNTNIWIKRWEEIVDARFFDDLQTELEADETERKRIRRKWLDGVVDHARTILHAAEDGLPCSTSHRYKARAQARNLFEGRIRGPKGLPFLFQNADEENE